MLLYNGQIDKRWNMNIGGGEGMGRGREGGMEDNVLMMSEATGMFSPMEFTPSHGHCHFTPLFSSPLSPSLHCLHGDRHGIAGPVSFPQPPRHSTESEMAQSVANCHWHTHTQSLSESFLRHLLLHYHFHFPIFLLLQG